MNKYDIRKYIYDFPNLCSVRDSKLFSQIVYRDHCSHHFVTTAITERDAATMMLRSRGHNYSQPAFCHLISAV
jgi:hypothetical protein